MLGGDGSILHALRRFARSGVPVFGVNFGTVGFLAAVERERGRGGDPARPGGRDRGDRAARPRGRGRRRAARRPQRRHLQPPSPRPRRRAELQDRRRGGRPRPLRRARRRDPGRLDRLQPRQPGPDPRLGGEGVRGQLHRPALADRARPGRRPGRRAPRRQRGRPRAGRRRGRRRRTSASSRRAPRWRSASPTTSAGSPSCRGRASTSASARSSATWPSERPAAEAALYPGASQSSRRCRLWSASGGPSS